MQETHTSQALPQIWSKNLVLTIFAALSTNISGQVLMTALPLYVTELGIDARYAGIMTTAYALGSILFRPFVGQIVDTVGRRKTFMTGAVIVVFACSAYTIAPNFAALFCCRMVHGLGFCLTSTAAGTIAADVVPQSRLTEGLGYYGISGAIAQTAGPALGLALLPMLGIKPVFIVTAVMALVSAVAASQIRYKENRREAAPGEKPKVKLIEKNALLPASMIFFVSFCQCSLTTFLALFGQERAIVGVGNFFLINSIGIIVSRLMAGKLTRRFGEGNILMGACAISLLCFLMVSFAESTLMVYVAALIYGFGYGILYPLTNGMSMRHVDRTNRGAATATFVGIFDLGTFMGTFFWGQIGSALGYANMYRVAASLMIVIVLIYRFAFLRKYPQDKAL